MGVRLAALVVLSTVLPAVAVGGPLRLEQVVSREYPLFVADERLTVGRDGRVYLPATTQHAGYVVGVNRDGTGKRGGEVTYALLGVAANADGVVATANGHFAHAVNVYGPDLVRRGGVDEFRVGDDVGYDAPMTVEAGAESGDFYAPDRHRNRVVRVAADGRLVAAYPMRADGEPDWGTPDGFRACERTGRFVWHTNRGELRAVDRAGRTAWVAKAGGVYDIDPDGRVYALAGDMVERRTADGGPDGSITLTGGDRAGGVTALRVFGDDIVLKRRHPTELLQVYDRRTGAFRRAVHRDADRLTLTSPSDVWPAGGRVPLAVAFDSGPRPASPVWRVYVRPIHAATDRELPLADGAVTPPADLSGLCVLTVSAGGGSEYRVRGLIEVRRPGAKGSAAVVTPANRVYYGRGEAVPLTVLLRVPDADRPKAVTVRLLDGQTPVAIGTLAVSAGGDPTVMLPATLTASLRPGSYLATADADGLTVTPHPLVIGPGFADRPPFRHVEYGDYGRTYPTPADAVAAHLNRHAKLGTDLFVDRLGHPVSGLNDLRWTNENGTAAVAGWERRLAADPLAPPPAAARGEPPLLRTLGGYSALGASQMALLMYMDAGLPVGTGFDTRKPEQLDADIGTATRAMRPYPAFRGWSWAANWWVGEFGARAARTPAERAAYDAAARIARETGRWDPVLDRVSDVWLGHAVSAQERFNAALHRLAPGKTTAVAGAYRNVSVYPPVTFRNVDEVDLHFQLEQIAPPLTAGHNAAFQRRPGKPAWGHPEVWNDSGTGEQVVPTLFQMLMRGATGVGRSGADRPWGPQPADPRQAAQGLPSVWRAVGELVRRYGPWLTTLEARDPVAIVVSSRPFRLDDWHTFAGKHFLRLFEAWNACQFAGYPASFVFLEDVRPGTLERFPILLFVDRSVELEAELTEAVQKAAAAGSKVFFDRTSRKDLFPGGTPLDAAFTAVVADRTPTQDDSAYGRIADACKAHGPALRAAFGAVRPPVAAVAHPDVLVAERANGDGRFVFLANNALPPVEPGVLWRVGMAAASRVPVRTTARLDARGAVYDVFAHARLAPAADGTVPVDLRTLPARLLAVLPEPIAAVGVGGPAGATAGVPFAWRAEVRAAGGKPVNTSVPVRVRLLSADGKVLEDRSVAALAGVADGRFTPPLNAPIGPLTLETTEEFGGMRATHAIPLRPAAGPFDLAAPPPAVPDPPPARVTATDTVVRPSPADLRFGPHLRDVAVSGDGSTALFAAAGWGENLFAVDAATGAVRRRERLGHWGAIAPRPAGDGFAVEGYDLTTAAGYHLYRTAADGRPDRRFPLYGLPKRLTNWAFASIFADDRIDGFAAAPDGGWLASAGDNGLAVWSADGRLRWSRDGWRAGRKVVRLVAAGPRTLVVADGMTVTAHDAATGAEVWTAELPGRGAIRDGRSSADGRTLLFWATTEAGGRVFAVRDGRLALALPADVDDAALAPDGAAFAVVTGTALRWYTVAGGFRWSFAADDVLRLPRVSPDGTRVAAGTELGTLVVLDADGRVLLDRDVGAIPAAAWMPGGDLVYGTWAGDAARLDARFDEVWRTHLEPAGGTVEPFLPPDRTPTAALPAWGNADPTPAALAPNLLRKGETRITVGYFDAKGKETEVEAAGDLSALADGRPAPPPQPWLRWHDINAVESGWHDRFQLKIDTFRTRLRVTGVSLVEDPAHPNSWVRDAVLEAWDPAAERWADGRRLLSDAATHTHRFARPLEGSRFRLVGSGGGAWPVGNLRLAEVVFHGERLGGSHPDLVARRPVATLFDESDALVRSLIPHDGAAVKAGPAFAGGRYLHIAGGKAVQAAYTPQFGHTLPDWDFPIAERPGPGEYRYLEFAWRAGSPATAGMALNVGESHFGGRTFVAGTGVKGFDGDVKRVLAAAPPLEWAVVRVDLWRAFGRPVRVRTLALEAVGGPAEFDRVRLGRTEADLK